MGLAGAAVGEAGRLAAAAVVRELSGAFVVGVLADRAAGFAAAAATALRLAAAGLRGGTWRATALAGAARRGLLVLDPGFLPGMPRS
jgi:hypothetical protein